MRKVLSCFWRPAGCVALGVVTLSVVAMGETRLSGSKNHGIDVNKINQQLPAGQRVLYVEPPLTEEDYVLPPRLAHKADRLERMPAGIPLVNIEQLDDASIARGAVSTGFSDGDPAVFMANQDSGYFSPTHSVSGNFQANGLIFDPQLFSPGDTINAYEFVVFNSIGIPPLGISGPADINSELWTGDPLGALDTTCGDPATAIAGTACTFLNVPDGFASPCPQVSGFNAQPCGAVPHLRCELPAKTVINCDRVWLVWDLDQGCRVGWRLHGVFSVAGSLGVTPPDIGVAHQYGVTGDCALFNACGATGTQAPGCAVPANGRNCGTCCDNGTANSGIACDHTDGVFECVHNTYCTDGTADLFASSNYAPGSGSYAAYLATVYTVAALEISTAPIGNAPDGAGGATFNNGAFVRNGDELVLRDANAKTWAFLEWRIGEWDTDETTVGPNDVLRAYQVAVDVSGFTSGSQGTLTIKRIPCPDGDLTTCTNSLGEGSNCDFPAGCKDPDGDGTDGPFPVNCECEFIYFDGDRGSPADPLVGSETPYVFADDVAGRPIAGSVAIIGAPDLVGFRIGATLQTPATMGDPVPFPANGMWLGTMVLDVPSDARGTFTIKIDPSNTNVTRGASDFIPLLGLRPGKITVETGKCCRGIGSPAGPSCEDGLLAKECTGLGTKYTAGGACTGVIDDDCPACTAHDQCADGDACTIDRCSDFTGGECSNTAVTVPAASCCDSATTLGSAADVNGTGAICGLDDGEVCTVDACSAGPASGTCNHVCTAGIGCNDANPCTYGDSCDANCGCAGSDVNAVDCTTSADCETATGVAFDCLLSKCFCTIAPVCGFSDVPACVEEGAKVSVDLRIGAAAGVINGVQITVGYDPSCLDFNSIVPAGSVYAGNPYVTEIEEIVDEAHGSIFYAVGVDPLGGVGVNGNVAIAVLSFTKVGDCNSCSLTCGGGANPQDSLAVDNTGQPIFIEAGESGTITSANDVDLNVPDDVKSNVDCDFRTAIITWDAPTASSDCPGGVNLVCSGSHEGGYVYPQDVVLHGGELPVGTSTFCCTASETACDNATEDCWTVVVNERTTLDVTVQLSPIITGELDRCICFQLYSDCVQAPLEFCQTLHFGGLFDHVGHFTDDIKIPDAGQWFCITARDQLHTLRSSDFLECVDGDYIAVFKGDPFFGGNWLIGGNLDGWKKFNPNASHNVIDILDFGQFVANFGAQVDPDSPCPTAVAAHADINGDGVVNSLDYAFITRNFLAHSKNACCPGSAAAESLVGRTEISVRELRELDMGDLAVADLNGDGVVNTDDMAAFMAGQQPPVKNNRPHTGGLRSSKR